MDPRPIDPSTCWVRHIKRAAPDAPGAVAVAGAHFAPADIASNLTGINGRGGWSSATVTLALSDDGTFNLTLPNAAGDDGILHRQRFAIFTDDTYEPGEEWIEVWSDADAEHPLYVGTPTEGSKSRATIELSGVDLGVVLDGSLTSDIDFWPAHAPRDLMRFYSQVPVSVYSQQDMGLDVTDADVSDGYTVAWQSPLWVGPSYGEPPVIPGVTVAPLPFNTRSYSFEIRLRILGVTGPTAPTAARGVFLSSAVHGFFFAIDLDKQKVTVSGGGATSEKRLPTKGSVQPITLRVVHRAGQRFLFLNGELVDTSTRLQSPEAELLGVYVGGARIIIDAVEVEGISPFAMRGDDADVDLRLPGLPPGTGLRAQYWNRAPQQAVFGTTIDTYYNLPAAFGTDEATTDRVEPYLFGLPGSTAPSLPGAYSARWSGAIYLPFEFISSDARLRLNGPAGVNRIFIGRTERLVHAEAASSWPIYNAEDTVLAVPRQPNATIVTPPLGPLLGTTKGGWYPLVIERYAVTNDAAGILEIEAAPGQFIPVEPEYLSPIGVYENDVRLDTHRNVLVDVAAAFGYQWRTLYRSLESGQFPGQIVAGAMIGRSTDVVVRDIDIGSDPQVRVSATDVIDRIAVDGAGIADPSGSGQLTVQTTNYPQASDRLSLRSAYESLSDISEAPLLMQRANSLLALRSGPNDQVGVQPDGRQEVTDTFPLTGDLGRFDWAPGDGVRLDLEAVDVRDASTRQLTTVAWPCRPDGIGKPTVGFRQRPRNVRASMRRLVRAIYGPRRTYQGALTITSSNVGLTGIAGADPFARASLPSNTDSIKGAWLVVQYLSAGTDPTATIEVNGQATGIRVPHAGRYDISAFAIRAEATGARMYARIATPAGTYECQIELLVAV